MAYSSYSNRARGMLGDYANIRTLPAVLSVAFVVASLYQFGGIGTVELSWISYTLTAQHAVLVSMASFAIAFASSETKEFDNYEKVEQVLIAAGPVVILGHQYVPAIKNFIVSTLGNPIGLQMAFLLTLVSWGVAVR